MLKERYVIKNKKSEYLQVSAMNNTHPFVYDKNGASLFDSKEELLDNIDINILDKYEDLEIVSFVEKCNDNEIKEKIEKYMSDNRIDENSKELFIEVIMENIALSNIKKFSQIKGIIMNNKIPNLQRYTLEGHIKDMYSTQ